jgi:hypothetical protein
MAKVLTAANNVKFVGLMLGLVFFICSSQSVSAVSYGEDPYGESVYSDTSNSNGGASQPQSPTSEQPAEESKTEEDQPKSGGGITRIPFDQDDPEPVDARSFTQKYSLAISLFWLLVGVGALSISFILFKRKRRGPLAHF